MWATRRHLVRCRGQTQPWHTRIFERNRRPLSAVADLYIPQQTTVTVPPSLLRNIAIIAHVDHGKTTLVDKLLQTCSGGRSQGERLLDSGDLEKERGITIMSKCTRLDWSGHTLNVVDTPGHADFGGEVERVMDIVDGVLLVVDATEGPMSQTKFVLGKALAAGLQPIVVLNKVDRPTARLTGEVENSVFDLFVNLGANDEQLDYPMLYASARQGWVTSCTEQAVEWAKSSPKPDMSALFQTILERVPPPCDDDALDQPFAMAINNIGSDPYLGQLASGKIESGTVQLGQTIKVMSRDGVVTTSQLVVEPKITGLFITRGVIKEPLDGVAGAGDIVTIAGVPCGVGDTVTCATNGVSEPLETIPLAPPTLSMTFGPNDGPLAGKDGAKFLNSSQIKDRLYKEVESNVTLVVKQCPTDSEKIEVHGRGEMQLGILVESMRREGYEFCVSPPRILMSVNEAGQKEEPIEEVTVDVDTEYQGIIMEKLTSNRKGALIEVADTGAGKCRMTFHVPSRGLLGFGPEVRMATQGSAVVNSIFLHKADYMGQMGKLSPGKLVATEAGKVTSYALAAVQERGKLFVANGDEVYTGMIIGENPKAGDLDVNPSRTKKLTNIRTQGSDEVFKITPPVKMSVEECISYMGQDEIMEVTPKTIRLRKAVLETAERQRLAKSQKKK